MKDHCSNARPSTFTVAVVGPDGAGKTTVCRELEGRLAIPCKYLYMGYNPDAATAMLPTTRWMNRMRRWRHERAKPTLGRGGPNDASARVNAIDRVGRGFRRIGAGVNSCVGLAARVCEEWYRQQHARRFVRDGYIVVFDRHFLTDYWANENGDRSVGRRIHGFLLERTQSKPDLVIYLDAPAELLYARKHEGTMQSLERQRLGYLGMRDRFDAFQVVDATQALDAVVSSTVAKIVAHYEHYARNSSLIGKLLY